MQKAVILPFCWSEVGRTKEVVKETNLHLGQRSKRENAIWPGWLGHRYSLEVGTQIGFVGGSSSVSTTLAERQNQAPRSVPWNPVGFNRNTMSKP